MQAVLKTFMIVLCFEVPNVALQDFTGDSRGFTDESFKYFSFDYHDSIHSGGTSWVPESCYESKLETAYGFSVTPYTKGRSYVIGGIDSDRTICDEVFLISSEGMYRCVSLHLHSSNIKEPVIVFSNICSFCFSCKSCPTGADTFSKFQTAQWGWLQQRCIFLLLIGHSMQ